MAGPGPVPPQREEKAPPSDKAVAGLCDLLGLMFALPFGEDLYRDTPITGRHIAYLVLGLVLAGIGHMWPRIKASLPQRLAQTVALAALDFRVWIGVLLIVFLVSVGPEIYQRALAPSIMPTADEIAEAVMHKMPSPHAAPQGSLDSDQQTIRDLRSQLEVSNRDRDLANQQFTNAQQQLSRLQPHAPEQKFIKEIRFEFLSRDDPSVALSLTSAPVITMQKLRVFIEDVNKNRINIANLDDLIKNKRMSIPIMRYSSNSEYYWGDDQKAVVIPDDLFQASSAPVEEVLVKLIFIAEDGTEQYYCEPTMWPKKAGMIAAHGASIRFDKTNCAEWQQAQK